MKTLYLVIPCYNETEVLPETSPMFREKIHTLIHEQKISENSRVLFVDDGSRDETWKIISSLARQDEIFEGIPAYLHDFDVDERDMTKFIIGTVSALDAPLPPAAKGIRSMSAYLSGVTDEDAQQERDEVLQATAADIRALEPLVESVLAEDCLCVIGNEDTLTKEKDMFINLEDLF